MILRLFLSLIATFIFLAHALNTVSAQGNVPEVVGQIYNYDTGLIFAGPSGEFGKNVWLQWRNKDGSRRFARTGSNTFYKFRSQEGTTWGDIFVRSDGASIECLTKQLCEGCSVQSTTGENRCGVSEFTTNKDATFTCGGNPHSFSVITPNLLEGKGSFYLKNSYDTQTPISTSVVNLHNGQKEKVINWDWVPNRPLAPPQCPKNLKVVCSQDKDGGKIKADFTWSHDEFRPAGSDPNDVSQFVFILKKSSLDFITQNVAFIMDPAYSGGSTLDASNKHLYTRSTTQSIPVWLEAGRNYTWMVQPGRRSWSIPYNNLWDSDPYNSPWCPAEPVNCSSSTEDALVSVTSCQKDAIGEYNTTASIDVFTDFFPTYDTGELQIEFTIPSGSQLTSLLTEFLAGSIAHQESSGTNTIYRVSLKQVNESDFDWSGGLFGRVEYAMPNQATTLSNGRTLSQLNQVLADAGFESLEQYTQVLFVKSYNGINTIVGRDSLELLCSRSVVQSNCTEVYTSADISLVPTIQESAQNLTISWTIGEGATKQSFLNAISRYTLSLEGKDGSIDKTADKSALSIDIPLSEIKPILGDSNQLSVTLVPYVETVTPPFEDACPASTLNSPLTYTASISVSLVNPSTNECVGTQNPNFSELSGLLLNTQLVTSNPTALVLPYLHSDSTISLTGVPSNYFCASCNPSCQKTVSPTNPSTTIYIHSGLIHSSWWQVMGGLIFANEQMRSSLPLFNAAPDSVLRSPACTAVACNPFLARTNPATQWETENSSAGVAFTNSSIGPTSVGARIGGWIRQATNKSYAEQANYTHTGDRYIDFFNLVNPGVESTLDTINNVASLGVLRSDGTRVVHVRPNVGSTVSINQPISLATERIIVFVNGDLKIDGTRDQKMISVPDGAFLSFIVKGNIEFTENVGRADPTSEEPVVEGIYLANGSIITANHTSKFIGAGTFVGWGGVSLNRLVNDVGLPEDQRINDKYPLELFIHRPDFVINTPDVLKTTKTTWQEVN